MGKRTNQNNYPGSTETKAVRQVLTKLHRATAIVVRAANYENGSAGLSRHIWQRERGARALKKLIRKPQRLLKDLEALATPFNREVRQLVLLISYASNEVLSCCSEFPGDREWPGNAPLDQQKELIGEALHLLRGPS